MITNPLEALSLQRHAGFRVGFGEGGEHVDWFGTQRILNIQPKHLHERVNVILGSKNEVKRVTAYHSQM